MDKPGDALMPKEPASNGGGAAPLWEVHENRLQRLEDGHTRISSQVAVLDQKVEECAVDVRRVGQQVTAIPDLVSEKVAEAQEPVKEQVRRVLEENSSQSKTLAYLRSKEEEREEVTKKKMSRQDKIKAVIFAALAAGAGAGAKYLVEYLIVHFK